MAIIPGILYVLVGTAAACLFVYEHMSTQIRSICIGTHDPLFVETNLGRSDMVLGALQR